MLMAAALAIATFSAHAKPHRSHAATAAFKRVHPCPSTGKSRGACPGYTIDHRIALCVGGEDDLANMRWQTHEQSLAKDRWECKPGWEQHLAECEASGCFIGE